MLLALVGPTGIGKTEVALELAPLLGAEILSVDSRQVYRRLDIGTAKPTHEQQSRVRHHLIDLIDVTQSLSAGEFRRRFDAAEADVRGRSLRPLAVGGSGLYLRAVTHGLFEGPGADPELRRKWEARDTADLRAELGRVDPESAVRLSAGDRQRIVRALEVFHASGRPLSDLHRESPGQGRPVRTVGLHMEREALYARINRRVEAMDEAGLEAEARWLYAAGLPPEAGALRTVGYREWAGFFEGRAGRDEALELIRMNTRRYAKRQLTWFRGQDGIAWLNVGPGDPPATTAQAVLDLFGPKP